MTKSGSHHVNHEYSPRLYSDLYIKVMNFMSCISHRSSPILRSNDPIDLLHNE